jgi:ABC-type lipoprotein release transport system permease subunit
MMMAAPSHERNWPAQGPAPRAGGSSGLSWRESSGAARFSRPVLVLILPSGNALPMPAMSRLPIQWTTLILTGSGTVAVAAALPPAFGAANLTPVEALRHER